MKRIKKKIILISLLVISIFMIMVGMYCFFKNEVQAVGATTINQNLTNPIRMQDPGPPGYATNTGTWTLTATTGYPRYIPKKKGFQIYCIEHPGNVNFSGLFQSEVRCANR